jgi:hypothetical protein
VKAWLSRREVPFAVKLVTEDANREELQRLGVRSVPVSIVGERQVQGHAPAELEQALRSAGWSESAVAASVERASEFAPRSPLSDAVVCAAFVDGSLTAIDGRRGRYLGDDLRSSTIPVPGSPLCVAASRPGGSIVSMHHDEGTVTFLKLADGSFLNGDRERSTLFCGDTPISALAHPTEPLVYVSCSGSRELVVLDSAKGSYAFGSFDASRKPMPGQPGAMALDALRGILYVRFAREGVLLALDARTLAPRDPGRGFKETKVSIGRGVAVSADGSTLYVPYASPGPQEGLALLDAHSGAALPGKDGPLRSCAATPLGLLLHPSEPILYLACVGERSVEWRSALDGEYLRGDRESSSVQVGGGARAMAVDPGTNCLYVASFDDSSVVMLNARTGAYLFGTREASTIAVGAGPRDLCVLAA